MQAALHACLHALAVCWLLVLPAKLVLAAALVLPLLLWIDLALLTEDWIVVLDSDMIMRRPFLPSDFNLSRGWAVGAKYDYMIGASGRLQELRWWMYRLPNGVIVCAAGAMLWCSSAAGAVTLVCLHQQHACALLGWGAASAFGATAPFGGAHWPCVHIVFTAIDTPPSYTTCASNTSCYVRSDYCHNSRLLTKPCRKAHITTTRNYAYSI
jgi:hypothetical protein